MASTETTKVQLWRFPTGGITGFPPELGFMGWADSKLCQSQEFPVWWAQQVQTLEGLDHDKVVVIRNGQTIGGIVLIPSVDAQVGQALHAFHQFIDPAHRHEVPYRSILRRAEQAAQQRGLKWLVWTHRDESRGKIFYTYKEV